MNTAGERHSDFAPEPLLEMLGSEVSRLALVDDFSFSEAVAISEGKFSLVYEQKLREMVFDEHPVTGNLFISSWLRKAMLRRLTAVFPRAPHELAELLLESNVGPEVCLAADMLPWLVAYRTSATVRATLAALAAYSPFEVHELLTVVRSTNAEGSLLSRLLVPYSETARAWLLALSEDKAKQSSPTKSLVRVDHWRPQWLDPTLVQGLQVLATGPDLSKRSVDRGFVGNGRLSPRLPLHLNLENGVEKAGPEATVVAGTTTWATSRAGDAESLDLAGFVYRPTATWVAPASDRRVHAPQISDSTRDLVKLIRTGRGRTVIIEKVSVDVGQRLLQRSASVGITDSAPVNDTLIVHLGSLPSSIGRNLPASFKAAEDERLVSGAGPTVSAYCEEISRLLRAISEQPDMDHLLPASEWSRLSRSIREPWRFISTARPFVNVSEVRVSWSERVTLERKFANLWPFTGASGYSMEFDGFWHGDDDFYSVNLASADGYRVESLEIRGTPRLVGPEMADSPASVKAHLGWSAATFRSVLLTAIVSASILAGIAASGVNGSLGQGVVFNYLIPLLLSVFSPIISLLLGDRDRGEDQRPTSFVKYRVALSRGIWVAIPVAVLVIALATAYPYGQARQTLSMVSLIAAAYLFLSAAVAVFARKIYPKTVSEAIHAGMRTVDEWRAKFS